jgi:ABC-type sulfate transport system permease component
MNTTLIVLCIALILVVLVFLWKRSRGMEIKSFWDVVRNPYLMPDLKQYHKNVAEAAEAMADSES